MISSKKLLTDLKKQVTLLENDLRQRCKDLPEIDAPLRAQYDAAKAGKRTAMTYGAWLDEQLTQVAVAWVLACVFVRFLEDNALVDVPKLAGPGDLGLRARDEHELFFQKHPTLTEREYLEGVFTETGTLPAMREFFDRRHNPLWQCGPSGDAAAALLDFWRKADPDTGLLVHDFSAADGGISNLKSEISTIADTRFLGDLYQDLSEAARKKYALLQTPEFIEEFILDRTLGPAINDFGYQVVRMIDPTCGSGHFLLGGFFRMFRLWQQENPGENPRVLAQNALNAIHGVDLNPYAVAIARFRLLLAALQVCGITKLKNAPDFTIHLASGDSLLHGRRFREMEGVASEMTFDTEEIFRDELKHHYEVEDTDALHSVLGQQYHAVVANPPYITVKDRAVGDLYRLRYPTCHRQYSLSVPFMERIFDLSIKGDGTSQQPAGYSGQITGNTFMKREFGKPLIETYLPKLDITHIVDTSGVYIPGHGTPTVILFGRNQRPGNKTIRTVFGIQGEPSVPEDPSQGLVWKAVCNQIDRQSSVSDWVNSADTPRKSFDKHPWSIGGGGLRELRGHIESVASGVLESEIETICSVAYTRLDEAYLMDQETLGRQGVASSNQIDFVAGDNVRDWTISNTVTSVFPYGEDLEPAPFSSTRGLHRFLWPYREDLWRRREINGDHRELDRTWWEWNRFLTHRFIEPLTITFAEIATNNNFVYDHFRRVFSQTSPVIKPKSGSNNEQCLRLVGLLNSSVGCFWLKQVCFPKGGSGIGRGIQSEMWEGRFAFDGTKIKQFPLTDEARRPQQLPTALVKYGHAMHAARPDETLAILNESGSLKRSLASSQELWTSHRRRLIAWQEELDWQVYGAFGLIEATDAVSMPEGEAMDAIPPDGINLGERVFEIVLARRMVAGEMQTTWFTRHGSTPITEIPAHWPAAYRELVERRIRRIESDSNIRLIEQPEYKRRWNTESWDSQFQRAATEWLLARLEGYFFEGHRVCDLGNNASAAGTFDPAAHGFIAASRPHLVSVQQLAEVVQADPLFLEVAECLEGSSGFSVSALVQRLVEAEAVPPLPRDRYKDSGLRNRQDWEETWRHQRVEDEIDAEAARLDAEIESRIVELVNQAQPDLAEKLKSCREELQGADMKFHHLYFPDEPYDQDKPYYKRSAKNIDPDQMTEWLKLEGLHDAWAEVDQQMKLARIKVSYDDEVIRLKDLIDQLPPKPDIAVPPKYGSKDFKKASYWKLRGKLDVPKERWISYPGAERDGDTSPVIAWAGWDHFQQAQALSEYFLDAKDAHGWPPAKLKPLLAALADLLPWLKQWHNTFDPNFGMGLGDYFQGFLEEQCRALEMTVQEVDAVRFEVSTEPTRKPARKQAKKRGRKGAAAESPDSGETGRPGHWQDQAFALLAPKRKKLTDYRMLVWPELLRQMPGEMEFETFRKAYWLLSEPTELEKLGRGAFPDVSVSWWRSRGEQLAKDEFLSTLKGSVTLGEVRIWKDDGVRFVRWQGAAGPSDFPEAVDDARIALQLATLWTEEEPDAVRESMERELVLLETP